MRIEAEHGLSSFAGSGIIARLVLKEVQLKNPRPLRVPTRCVAVIGAGVSGLVSARTLQDHEFSVTVFEKSHGPGGRTATRRADPGLSFDHGAQYFTAAESHFKAFVDECVQQGIVAEWTGLIVKIDGTKVESKTHHPVRYVGVPAMTAMASHLADELTIHRSARIVELTRGENGWELTDANGRTYRDYDYVIVSLPAPQSTLLLGDHALAQEVSAIPMTPCWAVLAAFESRIDVPWDGAFIHGSPLAWVARNSSKPGRNPAIDCWVLHASPDWSCATLEHPREAVAVELLSAFAQAVSLQLPPTIHVDAHRWLHSATPMPLDRLVLFDPDSGIAVCGDWLAGGRVEGAFRSGVAAAENILRYVGIPANDSIRE